MLIRGWCLQRINRAYVQIAHSHRPPPPSSSRSSALLETCMIASVILALAMLLAWVILGWGPGHPTAPGAW